MKIQNLKDASVLLFFVVLTSCVSNNTFNKMKKYQVSFYICYIYSEPQEFEINETTYEKIKSFNYIFNWNPNKYQIIIFKVRPTDYYETISYNNNHILIANAFGKALTPKYNFNTIYYLHKKENKRNLDLLKSSYKSKKLLLFNYCYKGEQNDSISVMLSNQLYPINKHTNFKDLIRR